MFIKAVADLVLETTALLYKLVYPHFKNTEHKYVFLYRNTSKKDRWNMRHEKGKASDELKDSLDEWAKITGLYTRCWTPWVKAIVLDTLYVWKEDNVIDENPKWWFEIRPVKGKTFKFKLPEHTSLEPEQKIRESFNAALEGYISRTAPVGHDARQRSLNQEHMRGFVRNWVLGESQTSIKNSVGKAVNLPIRDVALALDL
jgi:hypothetical protein